VLTLPPLPDHVQLVTDEDDDRLRSQYNLPSGPDECPTCGGTGVFLFYDSMRKPMDEREVVQYECTHYEQIVLQRYFLNHGVGSAYAQLWWADADGVDAETQKAAAAYADQIERNVSTGIGLYLHGGHGNGKSMVSSLLLKMALKKAIDGYWITLTELLSRYQETWRDKAYRNWFDRRMRNAALLVVDDMGREFEGRTTATSSIDTIFRTRAQNGLATIITTNLDDDEFTKRYTKGITSLVEEACDRVEVTGADWRSVMRERKKLERDLGIDRPFTFGTSA
jgi:DNA replication protein DnaC